MEKLKCPQCGGNIPCPDHTGDDGDTLDMYIPEDHKKKGHGK